MRDVRASRLESRVYFYSRPIVSRRGSRDKIIQLNFLGKEKENRKDGADISRLTFQLARIIIRIITRRCLNRVGMVKRERRRRLSMRFPRIF